MDRGHGRMSMPWAPSISSPAGTVIRAIADNPAPTRTPGRPACRTATMDRPFMPWIGTIRYVYSIFRGMGTIFGSPARPTARHRNQERETMIRNALLASVIAFGAVGIAQAQDAGPRLVGGGDNAQVVYAEPSHNVVGGGAATITGGGDNLRIAYGSGTTAQAQNGLVAELIGGGDNKQLVYRAAVSSGALLAERTARPRG
jgi:hypothetical protein